MNKWSKHEDYIVCKYTYESVFNNAVFAPAGDLMLELKKYGFNSRSEAAVSKRRRDYLFLFDGMELPHATSQVVATYHAFMDRINNPSRCERIKSYILESFNPDEALNTAAITNVSFSAEQNNLQNYIRKIEYASTFPMVLQRLIDKKGFKKYKDIYSKISMKQDTFSSILRGKYTAVKRENVLRLCVGLNLSIDEAAELMESAGFLFSNGLMTDVVVKAHLINQCYKPNVIDEELLENNVPALFSLA